MEEMQNRASPDSGFASVQIFADGNIQGLVQSSENSPDAIANGTLGISVTKENIIWVASINIASTTDSISSGFGNVILNPASGRSFTSGSAEFYIKDLFKFRGRPIGLSGYGNGSSSNWSVSDTVKNASVVGLGITLVNEVIAAGKGSNEVRLAFDGGFTYRGIYGDIASNESLYKKATGTTNRHFYGLELGLEITFNNITAGLRGYALRNKDNDNVDSVTSLQITGGITINGAFYKEMFKYQKPKKG